MTTRATTAARIHLSEPRPHGDLPTRAEGPPRAFHRTVPDYAPTPVVALPDVAEDLGVAEVWVKDESQRLGLPSFKILGGSWAVHRLLMRQAGRPFAGSGWNQLRDVAARLGPLTLCTATDGNHGRGVARIARLLGLDAVVYVPDDMVPARIEAIKSEGARVVVHPGDYDDAVAQAAADSADGGFHVVADVAYDGYTEVPRWVMDGYDTIFDECAEQLAGPPDVVLVQAGVGALAGAAVQHYASTSPGTRFGVVEPTQAACLLASAVAGGPVALASSQGSIMAGLNCGTPSTIAWPTVFARAAAYLAIPDEAACDAMRLLADHGVESGESGAAGLAGLVIAAGDDAARRALGLDAHARVLVLNTEGATDPVAYRRILARR